MTRIAFILVLLFTAPWEEAEIVEVKDRGPVDLAPFNCQGVTRSSVISRVCYDRESRHLLVERRAAYHQYCNVPQDVRDALLNAPSMGRYFHATVETAAREGNRPYDCRPGKAPSYQ
ncbi:KTSC domain-containing protein [Bradyrhizobium sp. RDI18]|uniref:KTSC domain-containing protein n=1 Tax=Bradyrhizobium sp. RDI18 TaxID=3367400 RepID=UPI0037226F49